MLSHGALLSLKAWALLWQPPLLAPLVFSGLIHQVLERAPQIAGAVIEFVASCD